MLLRGIHLLILAAWCGAIWAALSTESKPVVKAEQIRRDVAFSEFFTQHILQSLPNNDRLGFPLRPPDGDGVFIAGNFGEGNSSGEDWNTATGDADIGEPIYSIGDGLVTLAQDFEAAWGNVVLVAYRMPQGAKPSASIEVMYAHLNSIDVKPMQIVKRGQKIGTIGNANGLYKAHLHWEVRRIIGLGLGAGYDPAAEDTVWLHPTQTVLPWRGADAAPPKMRKVPPSQRVEWGTTAPGHSFLPPP